MPDVLMLVDDFMLDQLPNDSPKAGTVEDELQELVAKVMSCTANDGSAVNLGAGDVDATVVVVEMSRGASIKVIVTAHDHHLHRLENMQERLTVIKDAIRSWWQDSPEGLPYVSVRYQPIKSEYWVYDE